MNGLLFRRSRRFGNRNPRRDGKGNRGTAQLTPEQIATLRQLLDQRAVQLRKEIRERLIESGDDQAVSLIDQRGVRDDDALADLFADLDVAMLTRDADEVRDIEFAHKRLAEGSIDTCVECGRTISFERLRANPAARRCIECQRREERGQPIAARI
jgi:RNA polymerase-binding transcription factor DksA